MKILNKIKIENFKSIMNAEINLNNLNIFIGGNGAGKSNFIGTFKMLNNIISETLRTYVGKSGGADNILYFGRKRSDQLVLELYFDDSVNGYSCTLVPNTEGDFIFEKEQIWFHDKSYANPYREDLSASKVETKLFERSSESQYINMADHLIESLKSSTIYQFHDTSDTAKVKQSCMVEDNKVLRSNASNLAAFLYTMSKKNPEHFENIQDTVRKVAPFFGKFNLEPSRINEESIKLEWQEKGNDDYFNASALSDGTLRFICLATLLLQPKLPKIILLDEPELGLHPFAINFLASLIKKASKKTQIIIATQSVTFINQFDPDNIVIVERENEQTVFKRLNDNDVESWIDDYSIGDLWEKNIIGGRPK